MYKVLALLIFVLLVPVHVGATSSGGLVKTADSPAVYYEATDGKRYVFPNQQIYGSWFHNFSDLRVISNEEMASLPVGGNVTYRPGVRLVKIQSDPKVYAVERGGYLRWVTSESIARSLFGSDWNKKIDDLPVGFFNSYKIGSPITGIFEYSASDAVNASLTIESDKSISANAGAKLAMTNALSGEAMHSQLAIVPDHYLTVISVSDAAKLSYDAHGWESVITTKQSEDVEIYEVVFWNNGVTENPNKISVYKFDNSFDPNQFPDNGQDWVNYREQYSVHTVSVPSSCINPTGEEYFYCSNLYLDAFTGILNVIMTNSPAQEYALKYIGHGSSSGLFEGRLTAKDSESLLKLGNQLIGKKFAFLDWGFNCSMGNTEVLSAQFPYAAFIRSSDMLRQGFAADWPRDYKRLAAEGNLTRFFSPSKSIKQSLIEMHESERLFWETDVVREDMTSNQLTQSLSIYDASQYPAFAYTTQIESNAYHGDVLSFVEQNFPSKKSLFSNLVVSYVHNKDFFDWSQDQNGLWKN